MKQEKRKQNDAVQSLQGNVNTESEKQDPQAGSRSSLYPVQEHKVVLK